MGDRCNLDGWVHPLDAARFGEIVPAVALSDIDALGRFSLDEVNYGEAEALERAALAGLRFYAYSGPGAEYGAALTVGLDGEHHCVAVDHDGGVVLPVLLEGGELRVHEGYSREAREALVALAALEDMERARAQEFDE